MQGKSQPDLTNISIRNNNTFNMQQMLSQSLKRNQHIISGN